MTKSQEKRFTLIKEAAKEEGYRFKRNENCRKKVYFSLYEKDFPKYGAMAGHFFIGTKGGVTGYNRHKVIPLTKWFLDPWMLCRKVNK